jgi:DNA-binding beta-propeller fold protein YncE
MDLSTDPFGNLFVADAANHRIQKFTHNGVFLDSWGEFGEGDGQFNVAHWMTISPSGHLYASTGFESNYRIQKFDLNGNFIASWAGDGAGTDQFNGIGGIASDAAGNIYVSDFNHRIQKFDGNGTFLTAWGTEGDGDGQFRNPQDIVVNSLGEIYVVDGDNHRVQRFTSTGQFLGSFGALGGELGQLNNPQGIAVDAADQVYVADMGNHRICIFSAAGEFQAAIGGSGPGTGPGMFVHPHCVTVDASGRIFVSDSDNHRIQVFQKTVVPDSRPKAIIVAGGGAFPGNTIWEATEMCANFAYRTLLHQGYTRDTIHYLSENTSLDVDGNGIADDVDAPATNAHFQQAVTQWAADASDLLIYMADHGGFGAFRMSETELLDSTTFDVWLDALQQTLPGDLLMVYDACLSGSFLPALIPPEGKERYLIASAASDQEAILARGGTISFSYFFWMSLFNGDTVYNAFQHAKTMTESAIGQAPQMDTNGNGVGNEPEDFFIAQSISLGNQNAFGSDLPSFTAMTDRTLNGEPGTSLYVENMVDANGISRVWALIIPPIYSDGVRETPVTALPAVSLFSRDGERYESEYNGFLQPGAYRVTFYADDLYGARSLPKTATIVQSVAPDVRGDVNLKDGVTLADAILVLQTLAGEYTRPELAADVNGDDRIGLEEAGFILQKVAGAR